MLVLVMMLVLRADTVGVSCHEQNSRPYGRSQRCRFHFRDKMLGLGEKSSVYVLAGALVDRATDRMQH